MAYKRESLGFFPARCRRSRLVRPHQLQSLVIRKAGGAPKARERQGNQTAFCARGTRGLRKMSRERPGALLARRTRTMKRIGRTPTLVLCSRNARPEKGLVRQPHVDQHGCPSKRRKASELGGMIKMDEGRSMRVMKNSLVALLRRG